METVKRCNPVEPSPKAKVLFVNDLTEETAMEGMAENILAPPERTSALISVPSLHSRNSKFPEVLKRVAVVVHESPSQ
jgi:hypothetical protein